MARYEVYANPEPAERGHTPYLLDLQNNYISGLATRVVAPLRLESAFGKAARGLNPAFLISDDAVVLDTAALGAIPAQLLRQPVVSLRAQAAVISAALDTLFGGFLMTMTRPIRSTYEDFMRHVRDTGVVKGDRTGTGTTSVFGHQMRFPLVEGFPLVTTKKVHWKSIVLELLWFLQGSSNARWLQERGCTIWDEWAREDGELGPVYGVQWRSWPTPEGGHIDQISELIRQIKSNPDSRRLIVSAWNVADLPKMALMPCHALFQFYVAEGRLSCQLYQRSADIFLGVPFNIASYALLTHMLAQQCDLQVGDFIWTGGDCHLYSNHAEQVETQLARTPYPFPLLNIKRRPASIFDYEFDDFELLDYQHHPLIKAPVAV